jgi:hypothetical protein
MESVKLPNDWSSVGEFPNFNPAEEKLTEERLLSLTEDVWSASSADQKLVVDVSWLPQSDPNGAFKGTVIVQENSIDVHWTRDINDIIKWANAQINWCAALSASVSA